MPVDCLSIHVGTTEAQHGNDSDEPCRYLSGTDQAEGTSDCLQDYHPWRTNQSLNGDAPDGRPLGAVEPSDVLEFPAVHGLHHVYLPKAA